MYKCIRPHNKQSMLDKNTESDGTCALHAAKCSCRYKLQHVKYDFFNKYININKVTYMHNFCLDMVLFTIEELNIPGLSFESKLLYCST